MTPEERAESMVELVDAGNGYQSIRVGDLGPPAWHSADQSLMAERRQALVESLAGALRDAEAEATSRERQSGAGRRRWVPAVDPFDAMVVIGGAATIIGVGLVSVPTAVILGGLGLFAAGVVGAYVVSRNNRRGR